MDSAESAVCPYCGDDDHSLLKRVENGTLAACCTCGRHFVVQDKDPSAPCSKGG